MEIKYLGHSSFRIKGKTGAVVIDPYDSAMLGVKFPKDISANAVLVTHDHKDHNKVDQVGESPVVISGPGEYEVSGIKIFGYPTFHDKKQGAERGKNTIYVIKVDDIHILHVGDLGHKLTDEQLEEVGDIDILLTPVGGHYTIDAKEAVELVSQVEPKIVIPMHFKTKESKVSELQGVDVFIKEIGKSAQTLPKLSITSDKLPSETTVFILE